MSGRRVKRVEEAPKRHGRRAVEKKPITEKLPKISGSSLQKSEPKAKIEVTPKDKLWVAAWCVAGLCLGLLVAAFLAVETITLAIAAVGFVATLYFIWEEWFKKGKE